MRVLLTGSIAFDVFLRYPGSFLEGIDPAALQNLSMAFRMPECRRCHGGNAAYMSWALRLLGQEATVVSVVGSDANDYLTELRKQGVDTRYIIQRNDCLTAMATIASDKEEHQITFFHPGADEHRNWIDVEDNHDIAYAVVSPSKPSTTMEMLRWCNLHEIPTIFDPGQQLLAFTDAELWEALHLSRGLMLNSYEWSILEGRLHVRPEQLIQETIFDEEFDRAMAFVVVTRGEEGCTIYEAGSVTQLPACKAHSVASTIGSGDVFRAGFVTGLIHGWSLPECAKLGSAVASFGVEQHGALLKPFDWNELTQRAEAAYGHALQKVQ